MELLCGGLAVIRNRLVASVYDIWTPLKVPNLKLWLDFADMDTVYSDVSLTTRTANNGVIGGVRDKSGYGNHATQSTADYQPLFINNAKNNNGVGRFDGSNDYLTCGNNTPLQITDNITIYVVFKLTGATKDSIFISKDSNSGGRAYTFMANMTNATRFYINGGGSDDIVTDVTANGTTDYHIASGGYRKADKDISLYRNGTLTTKTATTSGIPTATCNVDVGRRSYASFENYIRGDIGEILLYNDYHLKATDRECIESYLRTKWAAY